MIVKLIKRLTECGCISNSDEVGRFTTKILEADEIDIHVLRPNELKEVAIRKGDTHIAFYIADPYKPAPTGFANEIVFWMIAYIENAKGSTTEIVKI